MYGTTKADKSRHKVIYRLSTQSADRKNLYKTVEGLAKNKTYNPIVYNNNSLLSMQMITVSETRFDRLDRASDPHKTHGIRLLESIVILESLADLGQRMWFIYSC